MRPNRAYYSACLGHWRSALALEITDLAAFRACRMGWLDRVRILWVALWPRLLGPFWLETSVADGPGGEVIHTTRVTKWGMTFLRGVEVLTLDENGRDVVMRGEHRYAPTPWIVRRFEGRVEIDATGTRASYELPWFGTDMRQTTARDAEGVTVTQETAWSRGVQQLLRASASRPAPPS